MAEEYPPDTPEQAARARAEGQTVALGQLGVSLYVCENCGQLGTMSSFQGDCAPGWTHGRLRKIESVKVTDEFVDWALLIFDEIDAPADPMSNTVREARASMRQRLQVLTPGEAPDA